VNTNENFVLSEPLPSGLRQHVADVLAGAVRSTVKSQEIPEGPEGRVQVLVGNNFEQVTQDPTKTVFVLFYAPWFPCFPLRTHSYPRSSLSPFAHDSVPCYFFFVCIFQVWPLQECAPQMG